MPNEPTPAQRTADATEQTAAATEQIAVHTDPEMPLRPQPSRPPTTTSEQDLRTAGQRRVNLIWEYSQASIALLIVFANILWVFALLVAAMMGIDIPDKVLTAAVLLSNAFFLVIGFYFGRTNHARIGDDPRSARRTDSLDDR